MTPSLFDLPVRTSEASQLAYLVFEIAGESALTPGLRQRLAARAKLLPLTATRPHFESLERDPVHPSALYLAADGIGQEPLLLRLAPAATPSSGLFPKAILIGRVRGPNGSELVLNAIPFGRGEQAAITTFASEVNPAFQPRPAGNRAAVIVDTDDPEAAFAVFRTVLRERGVNVSGFAQAQLGTWGAIRSGWREGWVNQDGPRTVRLASGNPKDILRAAQLITT